MKTKLFLFVSLFCFALQAFSQASRYKVAIFTPLYLDEAFNANGDYLYNKEKFPAKVNPGLEFYQGARTAIDSLIKQGSQIDFYVFDSKSVENSIESVFESPLFNEINLILIQCGSADIKTFAEMAAKKQIPVINCNYPNDGNTSGNPFFVVLNPTLYTECEAIYYYLKENYLLSNLVLFTKEGRAEAQIGGFFEKIAASDKAVPLMIKLVNVGGDFTEENIKGHLAENEKNICISGSLDTEFGQKLISSLDKLNSEQNITIIGMPTWDGLKSSINKRNEGVEVIYPDPFYQSMNSSISTDLSVHFKNNTGGKPTDMFYRGYETTLYFAGMLLKYSSDFSSNLATENNGVFTNFKIKPVINEHTKMQDYLENKNIYFLKWLNGKMDVKAFCR